MKIQELLPRLKKGWVAMAKSGNWYWCNHKPKRKGRGWCALQGSYICLLNKLFDIEPFDGDWKDSLMKCGEKK